MRRHCQVIADSIRCGVDVGVGLPVLEGVVVGWTVGVVVVLTGVVVVVLLPQAVSNDTSAMKTNINKNKCLNIFSLLTFPRKFSLITGLL